MISKPTVIVISGRKASGKTVFTVDTLLNEWRGVFDKIIIISPTLQNQSIWEKIDMQDIDTYDTVDDRLLNALMSERTANYSTSRMLVVFDDLGEDLRRCDIKVLNKLVSNSRHLQLSMCFLHQKVTQCHPIIRTNADTYVMFSSSSYTEREMLWKEVSVVDRKQFTDILNTACQEQYGALICSQSKGKMIMYNRNGTILFK